MAGNNGPGVLVEPGATATVRNSTLSDGLYAGLIDDGTASLFNSTVAFNEDGGIEDRGTLNLTNTIVAENGARLHESAHRERSQPRLRRQLWRRRAEQDRSRSWQRSRPTEVQP